MDEWDSSSQQMADKQLLS